MRVLATRIRELPAVSGAAMLNVDVSMTGV
jgi:hypothetical protein